MRDTTKDTDRISNIWRWIHNNLEGEPSVEGEDVEDCVIRLLRDRHPMKFPRDVSDAFRDGFLAAASDAWDEEWQEGELAEWVSKHAAPTESVTA